MLKKKIDDGLMNLFTKDFQPFRVVEDKGFKYFVQLLNASYKMPDRHTIFKVLIPAKYQKCVNDTKELLRNEATRISGSLTTDCWTSRSNIAYISLTYHFINTNFELKSVLLGCYEFSESHSGLNLCITIQKTLDEWEILNSTIVLAVSDNGSNIKNALSLIKIKSFGCFAHTLNLIVQDALQLEIGLIEKIKSIITHFKKVAKHLIN